MKIVLIACASKKISGRAKAGDLYISPLFKMNLGYAQSLNADKIFILSAKHGLLNLDDKIEIYNKTLNSMADEERKNWAEEVLAKLRQETDFQNDEFIFLAGEKYREHIVPHLKNYKVPMRGLGIGKQLMWLKQQQGTCHKLHELFNNMKRHSFPFNEGEIPKNGIYLLFEKGEQAHGGERIIRIGTHTGRDQLRSRLKQHFINENKDRSIFRKNIGRALLSKAKDDFLEQWETDLTTREAKKKFSEGIDFEKLKEVEKIVSDYIQNNFAFIVFPVGDKDKRLEIESKIISTVSLCEHCEPSDGWLGLHSPKEKIRKGGLWLVNELWKEPLTDEDFVELKDLIKNHQTLKTSNP